MAPRSMGTAGAMWPPHPSRLCQSQPSQSAPYGRTSSSCAKPRAGLGFSHPLQAPSGTLLRLMGESPRQPPLIPWPWTLQQQLLHRPTLLQR